MVKWSEFAFSHQRISIDSKLQWISINSKLYPTSLATQLKHLYFSQFVTGSC